MKAEMSIEGTLIIRAESIIESFALSEWRRNHDNGKSKEYMLFLDLHTLMPPIRQVNGRELYLPYDVATRFVDMEEVCYGEGIGPDVEDVLLWIGKTYPRIKEDREYLF